MYWGWSNLPLEGLGETGCGAKDGCLLMEGGGLGEGSGREGTGVCAKPSSGAVLQRGLGIWYGVREWKIMASWEVGRTDR